MKANAFQTTFAIFIAAVFVSTSSAQKVDWPMWGGTNDRNMVSEMEGGVSTDFNMDKGKNVVWSKLIGSQTTETPSLQTETFTSEPITPVSFAQNILPIRTKESCCALTKSPAISNGS